MIALIALSLAATDTVAAPSKTETLQKAPVVQTWAMMDYPSLALRNGWEGTVKFTVTVGTDGRVSDCMIVASSGYPELDAATCRMFTSRTKFRPATDANGKPVVGTYSQSMKWAIPK